MQQGLLDDEIVIRSWLVLATETKLGRLIVMRFEDRRVGYAVNRSNNDQNAKQIGQQQLENCFEHPALIVAQRAWPYSEAAMRTIWPPLLSSRMK